MSEKNQNTYYYSIPRLDKGKTREFKSEQKFDLNYRSDKGKLIDLCAEHVLSDPANSISTADFPMIFALHQGLNGVELCRFSVELKMVPKFESKMLTW
jgi:hypothetical protein